MPSALWKANGLTLPRIILRHLLRVHMSVIVERNLLRFKSFKSGTKLFWCCGAVEWK